MGKILEALKKDLRKLRNPKQAEALSRYFKTGKDQYGEGDIFLGLKVPEQRRIAAKYEALSLNELHKLLLSRIHEERLVSLLILVAKYRKADSEGRKKIVRLYLDNTSRINNWDLVDLSAPRILGNYLLDKNRAVLYKLAVSKRLWEKRIAVMATFAFIRNNEFEDAFKIAEMLLNDRYDLIHKAIGWMLREIGKIDQGKEEDFLKKHCKEMPRTMLRYAIERFDENKRKAYLKKCSDK